MTAAYLSASLVLVPACSSGDSDSGAVSACEFYCYCNSSLDCPNAGEQCVDSTCVPGFGDVGPDTTEPSTDVVEDTDTDVVDPNDTDTDTDTDSDSDSDTDSEPRPDFVRIEPGTFTMGSPEGEVGRFRNETQHTVTLTRAFLLQTTEVTQGQYESLMGANPSSFSGCGADCPVETVSWHDAVAYANALSVSEGLPACYDDGCNSVCAGEIVGGATVYDCIGYRLPTEAEWEYAARAGTTTETYAGDLTDSTCGDTTLRSIAWFCGNSEDQTNPVAGKAPNAWGLYDMHGNVWEWTSDWYDDYPGAVTDPVGRSNGMYRVLRGGSWLDSAGYERAAYRNPGSPFVRQNGFGFRVARSLP